MRGWLDCIGHRYWKTPQDYIKEAKALGITRRVAPLTLRRMKFGESVIGAYKKPGEKSLRVIIKWQITGVSGLNGEVVKALDAQGKIRRAIDLGGRKVQRGCGSYVEGPTWVTTASLAEIAELAKEKDCKSLMVMGRMVDEHFNCYVSQAPPVRLLDVPFTRSFRSFDIEAFEAALKDTGKRQLKGLFYLEEEMDKNGVKGIGDVLAQQVENYLGAGG